MRVLQNLGTSGITTVMASMVSDGGIDEPGKNFGHNGFNRHEQLIQELRHRGSSMAVVAGMSIHHAMAEVSARY